MKSVQLLPIDESGMPPSGITLCPDMVKTNCEAMAAFYKQVGFEPPWIGYVSISDGRPVGGGAFKGAPQDNRTEIAYYTLPEQGGRGFASATARGLIGIARTASPKYHSDRANAAHTECIQCSSPEARVRIRGNSGPSRRWRGVGVATGCPTRRSEMMRRAIVALSVAAIAASSLSQADPPASPTRDDYDAYLVAFTMEQHVASCRRYAPAVYSSFAETVERWRTENGETMLRLEAAARAWPLPGARSLDSILESMSRSTDEYYAEGKGELTDARCKRLLERVAGSAT